jgi:hypothetical protein
MFLNIGDNTYYLFTQILQNNMSKDVAQAIMADEY